jgi:hypothetical protein
VRLSVRLFLQHDRDAGGGKLFISVGTDEECIETALAITYLRIPFTLRTMSDAQIFRGGERVAVHLRGSGNGDHTTPAEHMPSSHRRHAGWTIERIGAEAGAVGPATVRFVTSSALRRE